MTRSGRHSVPARTAPNQPPGMYRVPPPLDATILSTRRDDPPRSGWRKAVYGMTAGKIDPGPSTNDRELDALRERVSRPISGHFRIAVLSIKGGVGKTTTTLGLGSVLAQNRQDRVIAIDANPDRGTLAQRVQQHSTGTVSGLLADDRVERYSDVRAYTRTSTCRLEVLGSDPDPEVAEGFSESDYRRAVGVLNDFYSIILSDCGTGIMHSAMAGVLDLADAVVVVSSPSLDAMRSAAATLDWLALHGHSNLSLDSHLVISAARPGATTLQLGKVRDHFRGRCCSIHLIPFDPHLAEGSEVDMDTLRPVTRRAYLELAASIADKFAAPYQHGVLR